MRLRYSPFFSLPIVLLILFGPPASFAQEPGHELHLEQAQPKPRQEPSQPSPQVFFPMADQPSMEQHHHGEIPQVKPQFPHLGDSQRVVSGPIYELEQLEHMATAHNPTLRQAQQAVEAARGRQRQSGLYPNPTIGYLGEDIRGGSYAGGEQGFFVEQPVILGGKLSLNRKVAAGEVKQRQAESDAQRRRVENDVRMAYYRVLAAQERLAIDRDLVAIAHTTVRVVHQLSNLGQADETEVLEAEVEEQRMELAAQVSEHMLRRLWTSLTSVIGDPSLPDGSVAGRIDAELPALDQRELLASLLAASPAIYFARAGVEKADAALNRARHETIPDLTLRGGLQQNFEPLNAPGLEVGLQGFAEIGLHLRLWDRNQGGIAAATAALEAAQAEANRVELVLRRRYAASQDEYSSARLIADRYRVQILPRLERAYKLMTEQYGEMTASFIRVLTLQRMLYENETGYISALEHVWTSSITLSGFLLDDGLALPSSWEMDAPDASGGKAWDSSLPYSGMFMQRH